VCRPVDLWRHTRTTAESSHRRQQEVEAARIAHALSCLSLIQRAQIQTDLLAGRHTVSMRVRIGSSRVGRPLGAMMVRIDTQSR
jgi:K+/H+ antiporter YhaU regulatory subunit KhtT